MKLQILVSSLNQEVKSLAEKMNLQADAILINQCNENRYEEWTQDGHRTVSYTHLLPEMFSYIKQGYDSVATRRVTRKGEPPIRSFFARMFYRIMNKISKTEIVDGARDYRLMTRQVVDSILSMCEYNRFTKMCIRDRYYIGVPGNFYDREKMVAEMFGFEAFEGEKESASPGDYGYYMKRVEI